MSLFSCLVITILRSKRHDDFQQRLLNDDENLCSDVHSKVSLLSWSSPLLQVKVTPELLARQVETRQGKEEEEIWWRDRLGLNTCRPRTVWVNQHHNPVEKTVEKAVQNTVEKTRHPSKEGSSSTGKRDKLLKRRDDDSQHENRVSVATIASSFHVLP